MNDFGEAAAVFGLFRDVGSLMQPYPWLLPSQTSSLRYALSVTVLYLDCNDDHEGIATLPFTGYLALVLAWIGTWY